MEWISRFDNKSAVVLGIDTGMLGVIASFAPQAHLWSSEMTVATFFAIFGLAFSLFFVYLSNYPQLKGPNTSLLYFGSIAKRDIEEYKQEFIKQKPEEQLDDVLGQCHRNAEILHKKFFYHKWSYRILIFSVIPWAITIYLFRSIPLAS